MRQKSKNMKKDAVWDMVKVWFSVHFLTIESYGGDQCFSLKSTSQELLFARVYHVLYARAVMSIADHKPTSSSKKIRVVSQPTELSSQLGAGDFENS